MIKRIALLVGSIAAAGVLALGLAAAGFGPATTNADQSDPGAFAATDATTADTAAEPVVQVQTETVYVRPPVAPKVIHVTKKVSAAKTQSSSTKTTKRVYHEDDEDDENEHENEHEGEDD